METRTEKQSVQSYLQFFLHSFRDILTKLLTFSKAGPTNRFEQKIDVSKQHLQFQTLLKRVYGQFS